MEIKAGSQLEPIRLRDQHDQPRAVDSKTKLLLYTRDKAGSGVANDALEGLPPEVLRERAVAYVADISGMPGLIARLFALPKLRKYPFSVLLARERSDLPELPAKEGQATLLRLGALRVERIEFFAKAEDLKRALAAKE